MDLTGMSIPVNMTQECTIRWLLLVYATKGASPITVKTLEMWLGWGSKFKEAKSHSSAGNRRSLTIEDMCYRTVSQW